MEIKIGMVAPSKAGKTSLLATVFSEMQLKLAGNQLGIQYWAENDRTRNAITRVMAEYRAITSSDDIFATPQMSGNVETSDYRFSYTIPVRLFRRFICRKPCYIPVVFLCGFTATDK